MKTVTSAILVAGFVGIALALGDCPTKKLTTKLICYYGTLEDLQSQSICKCSHVVLPANSDAKAIDKFRERAKSAKILITVNEFSQELVELLKTTKIDGIEINLKKLDSKEDIADFISTIRTKLGTDLYIVVSVPTLPETLAKYYDFKVLGKNADLFILQTGFLGASKNVTFHPSRLSGLWDMQNTDSVVDLVSGLGAPLAKLVVTSPVQAFQFRLQSENHTAPGSPALEVRSISRRDLCDLMGNGGNWTLERDQDQAGPYIFSKDQWIAFDDPISIDIKAKYARVRGLAGLALKDLSQDFGAGKCEHSLLDAAYKGLSKQARAPRGAVLHSLEREILDTPVRTLDSVQVSPYRISRVIDVQGNVHVVRQDTRTEFECSRQGYFVHPRSCGRFYRCVKFNQLSDEFSVFEFDCPAGLAFDERVEVCVWPGSLSHGSPCSGSSEIAPVPRERFVCPSEPGYYADPENCRWFFACLDHGKSPLSAYEFRCPFGLVYDQSRLLCEWPWLVPRCASGLAFGSEVVYGGSGLATLDRYDGLGTLGVTALGGLHGPLQAQVARVYSNVGHSGGLSINAAQTLEKAGLLNSGYSGNVGFSTANAGEAQYSQYGLKTGYIGLNNGQGLGSGSGVSYQSAGGYGSGYQNAYQNTAAINGNIGLNQNIGLSQNIGLNQDIGLSQNIGFRQDLGLNQNIGLNQNVGVNQYQGLNQNIGLNQYGNAYQNTASLNQNTASINQNTAFINQNTGLSLEGQKADQGSLLIGQINGLAYDNSQGQHSYQSGNQFQQTLYTSGQSGLNYGRGVAGNINIVKAGFSAVRPTEEGIQITNVGETIFNQAPVATVTPIPAVTTVPLPDIKAALGFETYNGGVVANVPELQYKVQNVQLQNNLNTRVDLNAYNYANATNQINVAVDTGYRYPKPVVPFSEEPVRAVTPTVFVSTTPASVVVKQQTFEGYDYSKPEIRFEEGSRQQGISYQQIDNVHTGNVVPVQTVGYDYPKPSIQFEERPQVSTVKPVTETVLQPVTNVQGYTYPKPAIHFEEKPQVFVTSTLRPSVNVQPALSVSFQGYDYPKPVIRFEESPQVHVTSTVRPVTPIVTSTVRPVVEIQQQQIAEVSHFQGYDYPKPAVLVEEKPQVVVTSYNVPSTTVRPVIQEGYHYAKPSIVFEERPIQTTARPVVISSTPLPVGSYTQGYQYPKPSISFEERPVVTYKQPVSTYSYKNVVQTAVSQGYSYPKPAVPFVTPRPVLQPSVSYLPSSTVRPVQQPSINYLPVQQVTVKPAISYSPALTPTVQPVVVQQPSVNYLPVQNPAVVSSYSYTAPSTGRPAVFVEQKPVQPAVSYLPAVTPTIRPVVVQQPSVNYLPVQKPAIVSSYSYTAPSTVKPAVYVEQKRVQPVISYLPAVTPTVQPVVVQQPSINYLPVQKPAVVSSYSYTAPSTERPAVYVEQQKPVQPAVSYLPAVTQTVQPVVVQQPSVSYLPIQKPAVNYLPVQQPTIKPAVISSYSYVAPSTPKPIQPVAAYLPVERPKPAIISRYSFVAPTSPKPPVVFTSYYSTPAPPRPVQPSVPYLPVTSTTVRPAIKTGYEYPKPTVTFVEEPQPVKEVPFVAKKAYVTGTQNTYQYNQQVEQRPIIVENYQPVQITTPRYEYRQQYSQNSGYIYEKPEVQFEEKPIVVENYQAKSVRPTFATVVNNVVAEKIQPFTFYDSRIVSTIKPVVQSYTEQPVVLQQVQVTTSKPIARYSFSSFDNRAPDVIAEPNLEYLPVQQPKVEYSPVKQPKIEYLPVEKPKVEYLPVKQPKVEYLPVRQPTVEYLPVRKVTTQAPTVVYEEPTREYLPVKVTTETYVQPTVEYLPVKKPSVEYLPVKKPTVEYLPVKKPTIEYLPVTTTTYETPTREYLPARKRVKVTTQGYVVPEVTTPYAVPTREYLPARRNKVTVTTARTKPRVQTTTERYIVPEVTTLSRDYLPARKRVKVTTVPPPTREYLPAQPDRGYLPVKAKTIVKVNDFHPVLSAKLGAQCTCASKVVRLRKKPIRIIVEEEEDDEDDGYEVESEEGGKVIENYEYEPQKIVEITPASTLVAPSAEPYKKRVQVRPSSTSAPVTEAVELFIRKKVTPKDDSPSDKEIAKAVRTGLKLVKQAAKEGAREGAEEALSNNGNVRLRGDIDCQRAGLFRHPTQCNKFYTCRWDCHKNKFTLHVFNCPVHLTFDSNLGACNWPSQGPACLENTLLPSD